MTLLLVFPRINATISQRLADLTSSSIWDQIPEESPSAAYVIQENHLIVFRSARALFMHITKPLSTSFQITREIPLNQVDTFY